MVGAAGFEPTTSRPPAGRATKLRHAPQIFFLQYNVYRIHDYKNSFTILKMQLKELLEDASRLRKSISEILRNL